MSDTSKANAAGRYCFNPCPDMAPLGEGRSCFALPIAGQPIYAHIALRLRARSRSPLVFVITDPGLAGDDAAIETLASHGEVLVEQTARSDADAYFPAADGTDLPFRYPWHLLAIQEDILRAMPAGISPQAEVERGAEIEGNVAIEGGARIFAGARIKGPVYIGENVVIGNNVFIRGATSLAAGSAVGFNAEIKNSLLAENCGAGPLSFVADSLIDHDGFLGGLARLSNYRLDGQDVEVVVAGRRVSTGRRQFGAIIGGDVKLGIATIVYPGRKIGARCRIDPRVTVVRNLSPDLVVSIEQNLVVAPRDASPQ